MPSLQRSRAAWRASIALLGALLVVTATARADGQRDPELRDIVAKAIATSECLPDKVDSAVWFALMEPRLRNRVKDREERVQILKATFCEAHRPGEQRLPPGLVLALMDVESAFDRWAVSSAGAVGLMQVMPFWPAQLGMKRHELTQVEANMRMGCAILRYYLKRENNDLRKALARYNGSVGRREYPDKVVQRWTTRWNGADDLGASAAQR